MKSLSYHFFNVQLMLSASQLCTVPVSDPRWSLLLTPQSENTMSPSEIEQFGSMLKRLDRLATAAQDGMHVCRLCVFPMRRAANRWMCHAAGVSLMVDAEQTYLQPAIDHCVQYLQQRYNSERAVVYNTIQAYLRDSRCASDTASRDTFLTFLFFSAGSLQQSSVCYIMNDVVDLVSMVCES